MLTKQQKNPYIWDYNIKVKTKDGYDYEEETKEKVKVKNDRIQVLYMPPKIKK